MCSGQPSDLLIRPLLVSDLSQAAALERECFGSEAWSEKAFEAALQDANALYLALVERPAPPSGGEPAGGNMPSFQSPPDAENSRPSSCTGQIIGCCGIWQSFEDGEIMNVAIKPQYRRRGLAVALLHRLMEQAGERGIRNFTLEVREGNRAAIGLYQSLGFQTEGIRKNFYSNPQENALIMWKR